jgi:hypothetical protein
MSLDRDSHAINQSYQEDASGLEPEVLTTALEKVQSIEEGLDKLIGRVVEFEVRITEAESLLEEIASKQDLHFVPADT